jgi:galactokinase
VVPLGGKLHDAGLSLAVTAPVATHALVARRRDPVVHASTANVEAPARSVFVLGEESAWGTWVDWVQGVTVALREHGHEISGHEISGFELLVRSDVPIDVGLGSSSALVVAALRALREAFGLAFDDQALVSIAHRSEAVFGPGTSRAAIEACVFASERHALVLEGGVARERIALPDDLEVSLLPARPPAGARRVEDVVAAFRSGHVGRMREALGTRSTRAA